MPFIMASYTYARHVLFAKHFTRVSFICGETLKCENFGESSLMKQMEILANMLADFS